MNHLLIGISVVLGTCVALLAVLLAMLGPRTRRRGDERVGEVVRTLELRMDELASQLAGAVARAEEEGRQNRFLAGIAGTIDLDEVLGRTLEAAAALPGAAASVVQLDTPGSSPVVAARGLPDEEAERRPIADPPDGRSPQAIDVHYRYAETDLEDGEPIRSGLAVPLVDEAGRLGYLSVFTRDGDHRFGGEDVKRLEELAVRAAPAIENARRFREARQLADLDALTGLHNRRFFHETLAREVARAHRYDRSLALVIFDLDDFKEVNDRIGHLAGDTVLAEAAERIQSVVRAADVPCRIGGDEFAVIAPESPIDAVNLLASRIQEAISKHPIGQVGHLYFSAGVAELRPEDDSIALFERADEALYRAKGAGKGRTMSA
ncbi:MAG TPA: sensor domain-containing diguanylate cyclase [Gaiellaceae bacterium]|nr:sensor domain-containing diguanylate cyclase [Gaiellaceae bacterium]